MARKLKKIPQFKNEDQEREYWAKHDSTEHIDWSKGQAVVLPKLKPSVKTISLRLPDTMLEAIKTLANKRDVPYQSLLKTFLADRIKNEFETGRHNNPLKTSKIRRRA